MKVRSLAFDEGQPIPKQYTGEGADVSPPLVWEDVPSAVQELALICDDPDAPTDEPWVHWLIFKLPGALRMLPQGVPPDARLKDPAGALQGKNSWKSGSTIGYRGPLPPHGHGLHHYHFTLYALEESLKLEAGVDKASLVKAMEGKVLAKATTIGTYER